MSGAAQREPLTVGSLFSGIGGFDLGLERTGGFRTLWFCEQDAFCQRVLEEHWPNTSCHPDVAQLQGANVEPVDVLCGGFPCQDLSAAGKGEGLTGSRSGLWFEFLRLIREVGPRYVLVENVPLLRKRGLNVVLEGLTESGYDAEWDGIPASAVGAHHQRDRFWLVAYPRSEQLREQSRRGSGPSGTDPALTGVDGEERRLADAERSRLEGHRSVTGQSEVSEPRDGSPQVADASRDAEGRVRALAGTERQRTGARSEPRREGQTLADSEGNDVRTGLRADQSSEEWGGRSSNCDGEGGQGFAESELGGVVDGIPTGLDGRWLEPDIPRVSIGIPQRRERLQALGNALVPQIAEWIGWRILEHEGLT